MSTHSIFGGSPESGGGSGNGQGAGASGLGCFIRSDGESTDDGEESESVVGGRG